MLGIRQFRIHGEREDFPAGFFGFGEIALGVAEVGEGLLQVDAERIVDFRRDTRGLEKGFEIVAAGETDRELIVDMFEFRGWLRWSRDE